MRFEELVAEPVKEFSAIFSHANIDLPEDDLQEIMSDYSQTKMRKRNLTARKEQVTYHYRKEGSDWRRELNAEHLDLFYAITGDLVDELGYCRR